MDYDMGISFSAGGDEVWKENATVADLIEVLKELPQDLCVSAYFDCKLDKDERIVYIEDRRNTALLDILLSCPMCREHVISEVDKKTLN